MAQRTALLVGGAILLTASFAAIAQTPAPRDKDTYSIMRPEPWVAPRREPLRGLPERPRAAKPRPAPPPRVDVGEPPPPIVLPNGRVVPNLPPVRQGIVPDGSRETFGDRAARCAHQSSAFGVPAGENPSYMHNCTMGQ